jgi:hypothetical protein
MRTVGQAGDWPSVVGSWARLRSRRYVPDAEPPGGFAMTELCISTAGSDLILIVRVLAGLRLTGRLHVVQGHRAGDVCFDQGQVVAAAIAAEQGLPALEAILITLPDGRCAFQSGVLAADKNLELGRKALEMELQQVAQRQAQLVRAVPTLAAVPRASEPRDDRRVDEEVTLPRRALLTLAAIDGRRSIDEICGGREVVRTLEDLTMLVDQGLIGIEAPPSSALPLVALRAQLPHSQHLGSVPSALGHLLSEKAYQLGRAERPLTQAVGQFATSARKVASEAIGKYPHARGYLSTQESRLNGSSHAATTHGPETLAGPSEEPRLQAGRRRQATRRQAVQSLLLLLTLGLGIVVLSLLASVSMGGRVGSPREPRPTPDYAGAPTLLGPASAPTVLPHAPEDASSSPSETGTRSNLRAVLEEEFAGAQTAWPVDPESTAWLAEGTYHVAVRWPGQFVAIGAPLREKFRDVVVTATFQKSAGAPGTRYGLIVRDQGPGPRDGLNTMGSFYALLVNDRGEFSIARRESDDWVDVLPWSPSDAIRPGNAANELVALAIGSQLGLAVNGTLVASVRDETLDTGAVGVYVNGDLAEVTLERFLVEVPALGPSDPAQTPRTGLVQEEASSEARR